MSHRQYSINNKKQQTEKNLLYLAVSSYDQNWQSMPHTHSFCELFFITGGEGYFAINGTRYPVHQNQVIIVNPHLTHTESTKEGKPFSYIVLGIENLQFDLKKQKKTQNAQYIYDITESGSTVITLLQMMVKESRQQKHHYHEILQYYLNALLLQIERITDYNFHPLPLPIQQSDCLYIKDYITEHYGEDITLDYLAKLMHRSRFYVSHTFSDAFGISPMHYLAEIRIIAAKNLLTTSDFSVQQIALMTGYSSSVYFSQAFKKNTGLSPKEFRIQSGIRKYN